MASQEIIECLEYQNDMSFGGQSEALNIAIEALKFAQWVADEIMDEELWELNYGAFSEIACRKLEKLGIVKSNNGYWELVEPQEKRCEDCKHYGKIILDCGRCDDDCSMFDPQESEEV